MVYEKEVEAHLRKRIKALGGIAYKWVSPGQIGVPDRIIVLPNGRVVFVELKRVGGKLSKAQRVQIARLKALGCDVRKLYGREDVDSFCEEVAGGVSAARLSAAVH